MSLMPFRVRLGMSLHLRLHQQHPSLHHRSSIHITTDNSEHPLYWMSNQFTWTLPAGPLLVSGSAPSHQGINFSVGSCSWVFPTEYSVGTTARER
ncbi:predicted protein [Plenodomus lingam JN3]|uniref:Predicted protein n=1 Tax=Leptosphaeria maculans (strain JN3 / isolate v23.1.3 / race Av1-4-5-6-7-8) TaxID=985895 RepID=E4ZNZ3_LEPMJ|nr:predicted protein [Plenodomus lingam JN3]CBX93362.1 predicted protein [Plenodomus lingam JN3]